MLMIISRQKSFLTLLKQINHDESVFIIGCNQCASLCHSGGQDEVLQIKSQFESHDIQVNGWMVLDPACHLLNDKRMLKSVSNEVNESDHILVLSCGNGVQVLKELYPMKHFISGTDTLFLGAEKKRGVFETECLLCGSCIVDQFEGMCPISHCPKQMLNGPCGGSVDGKCELGEELDCIWDKIIRKRLEKGDRASIIHLTVPKDWSGQRKILKRRG